MKILVTGGCGFLGSHVCEFYIKKGWEVVAYDNMTKFELERTGFATGEARSYNREFLESIGVKILVEDIRDAQTLMDATSGCDYLIHTAAQPAMTISWEAPLMDLAVNVVGTVHVLEAARHHKIPVAYCATGHVYGNKINLGLVEGEREYIRTPEGIDETVPILGGTLTPLHASKTAGDIYTRVYHDTYGVEACSFRLSGIYGTRQFGGEDHGWVANFAIRTEMDWPLTIFGTGKQVRDIVFAEDVCRAFDAFYNTRASGVYNMGGGSKTKLSLVTAIGMIEEIMGKKAKVRHDADRHGDLRYFVCDISKAKRQLGWEPEIMPQEGITRLAEWIKSNRALFKGIV